MAFDAEQFVLDELTRLEDQLKQAKAKQRANAEEDASAVDELEKQIDAWQKFLAARQPVAKTPKK